MSYLVLARKWRPQQLDDVVAQEHITQTLKNAILNNRLAHSYLFCGPRGVGKTTTARILAKALNCAEGTTPTPCNKCPSCVEITKGKSIDVLEIDGASNRGIEDIRDLREKVKYAPTRGRYKIYIIDEVHMLTTEAFNALLKTLEEPPEHVIFIFATTDPQKVPATVLSRCQRFDFRRIPVREIVEWLSFITKEENIEIEEEALFLISKKADGGMRDAESILDQIISFKQEKITADDVIGLLGIVRQDFLFQISDCIHRKDSVEILNLLDNLIFRGYDIVEFNRSLIEHFRNLMITKIQSEKSELLDIPPAYFEDYKKEAAKFAIEDLLRLQQLAVNLYNEIRRSTQPRIIAELVLVKMAKMESALGISELLGRLDKLESKFTGDFQVSTKKKHNSSRETSTSSIATEKPQSAPIRSSGIDVSKNWDEALEEFKKSGKNMIYSILSNSEVRSFQNNELEIEVTSDFFKKQLEKDSNKKEIEKIFSDLAGEKIRVSFFLGNKDGNHIKRVSEAVTTKKVEDYFDEPLIKKAIEIFEGEIIENS